ncbi:MAG: PQQ-binding-like beta-propeller repeat protein [Actinobacteria bacterium]|nr:PQQ-binding-like beta-propeller repeat protein [Actinomycetota bacterium]
MSARRPSRGAPYHTYVSEGGLELRRRQKRRRRTTIVVLVALIVVVAAGGAFVGTGQAQRTWKRFAGSAAAPADGNAASASPGATTTAIDVAILRAPRAVYVDPPPPIVSAGDGVKVATFLGDETRRLYGLGPPPKRLDLIWKTTIGSGMTSPVGKGKNEPWSGMGWTGQPAILRDNGKLYLMAGGFDRNMHKIELESGRVVWEYAYDDIIKSSPTVIEDPHPADEADRYLVLAGSRRGWPSSFTDPALAPYRAVSFGTGKEVWRLPVPQTASYSRDVDGSGFFLNGRMYSGVESGWFYKLDPFTTTSFGSYRQPKIVSQRLLLGDPGDASAHGGNLVLEASPSLIGDTIFISSGAGHVYGMRRSDLKVVWDYRTGSDLDGTPVPTSSNKLLVAVEKQYIPGHGGALMLDPQKTGSKAVDWFFPTGDRKLGDWLGGIIGSVAVNDTYDPWGRRPRLAAFTAIDGNLYVVAQDALADGTVPGPNLDGPYRTPKLVAKFNVGGGISTPIMVDDTIVCAAYDAIVHLWSVKWHTAEKGDAGALKSPDGDWFTVKIKETASFSGGGGFESTPVMWKGRVFIGSRDGSLYCLGDR